MGCKTCGKSTGAAVAATVARSLAASHQSLKPLTMRQLTLGNESSFTPHIQVIAMGEPNDAGTNQQYRLLIPNHTGPGQRLAGDIKFQDGLISQKGINGVTNATLLAIVVDRLEALSLKASAIPTAPITTVLAKAKELLQYLKES